MSESTDGDMVRDGDPILTPVTHETTDENGNTVVVGYPPSSNEYWQGTPGESPGGPGLGIGLGGDEWSGDEDNEVVVVEPGPDPEPEPTPEDPSDEG